MKHTDFMGLNTVNCEYRVYAFFKRALLSWVQHFKILLYRDFFGNATLHLDFTGNTVNKGNMQMKHF